MSDDLTTRVQQCTCGHNFHGDAQCPLCPCGWNKESCKAMTARVQQWQSVRAAGLIPEQWVTDAIVADLLAEVTRLKDIDTGNREQFAWVVKERDQLQKGNDRLQKANHEMSNEVARLKVALDDRP